MVVEAVDWLATPALTDATDATTYAMGCDGTVSEAVPCPGVLWRVPDSISPAPAGGVYYASIHQDGTGQLRKVAFTPVAGGEQHILWDPGDGPVTLSPGNTYTVQVFTQRYVFRGSSSYPYATPSGIFEATTGRLTATSDPDAVAAGNQSSSRFYVSPLIGTVDDEGITGTLGFTLPAFDADLSGTAAIAGTLALTLPVFDASLTGDVGGPGEAPMGLAAVMEEIATVLRTIEPRFRVVEPAPPPSVGGTPAAIVTFPERVAYDLTYRTGVEQYQRIAVYAIAGQPNIGTKTLLERIGGWLTGDASIKIVLEAHSWQSCDDVIVSEAEITAVTIAGVEYVAAVLIMDATGTGA